MAKSVQKQVAVRGDNPARKGQPTDAGLALFDQLADELTVERDVVRASMFGMPSLKRRGGKAFAGVYGDDMVFKLAGDAHAQALALPGAHLFAPMDGRPMKAWVQVPPAHAATYSAFARAAEELLDGPAA